MQTKLHGGPYGPSGQSLTGLVGMTNNPEVMVVLSDGGKPVSVIRALDDDGDVIGRGQVLLSEKSTSAGARKPADDAKRNFSANRYHRIKQEVKVI